MKSPYVRKPNGVWVEILPDGSEKHMVQLQTLLEAGYQYALQSPPAPPDLLSGIDKISPHRIIPAPTDLLPIFKMVDCHVDSNEVIARFLENGYEPFAVSGKTMYFKRKVNG